MEDFYVEDEPVEDVIAAYNQGEQGETGPPVHHRWGIFPTRQARDDFQKVLEEMSRKTRTGLTSTPKAIRHPRARQKAKAAKLARKRNRGD